jgi:hypothetical protein
MIKGDCQGHCQVHCQSHALFPSRMMVVFLFLALVCTWCENKDRQTGALIFTKMCGCVSKCLTLYKYPVVKSALPNFSVLVEISLIQKSSKVLHSLIKTKILPDPMRAPHLFAPHPFVRCGHRALFRSMLATLNLMPTFLRVLVKGLFSCCLVSLTLTLSTPL